MDLDNSTVEYIYLDGQKTGIRVFNENKNPNTILVPLHDTANKDYQAYLEKSILKFNFKSFTQVVILGSSTFVPFMQLTAPNRREVIEDLLDIQIFSRMNLLLKDRVKDIKDNQKECEHLMQIAEQQVAMQKNTTVSYTHLTLPTTP